MDRQREQQRIRSARYYAAHPEVVAERNATWKAKNPDRLRRRHLLLKYDITPECYEAMLTAQGHGCAICGSRDPGRKNRNGEPASVFAVDHDHVTGDVRGLLCHNCNTKVLGGAREDPGILRAAAAYVEKWAGVVAVLGAGPHGLEIAASVFGRSPLFDDNLPGYPVVSEWTGSYVIGAAWPHVRREIAGKAKGEAFNQGVVLFPLAEVSPHADLASHAHIGYGAVVSHGCTVGAFVNICAGVVLAGDVTVGDDVFIGINASVIHGGITIGRGATIGAGAVVTRDVPPGATVAGVPAKVIR